MCPCHSGGIREYKLGWGGDRHGAYVRVSRLWRAEENEGRSRARVLHNKLGGWAQSIILNLNRDFSSNLALLFFIMSISGDDCSRRTSAIDRDDGIRPLGRARTPALIGGAPFCSLVQKSGCAPDNGGIDGTCTVHGLHPPRWFSTLGSGEFDHAVSIDVSTSSSHDISQLDSTIQGLVDRSHEGGGQYRLYGTDQFTCHLEGVPRRWPIPRGPLCIITPKGNVSYGGGAPQSIFVEDS